MAFLEGYQPAPAFLRGFRPVCCYSFFPFLRNIPELGFLNTRGAALTRSLSSSVVVRFLTRLFSYLRPPTRVFLASIPRVERSRRTGKRVKSLPKSTPVFIFNVNCDTRARLIFGDRGVARVICERRGDAEAVQREKGKERERESERVTTPQAKIRAADSGRIDKLQFRTNEERREPDVDLRHAPTRCKSTM